MTTMTARERLFLTADRERLVRDGDPKAAFLYAAPGDAIPESAAKKFGLVDGELKSAKGASQTKPAAPDGDKAAKPEGDKSVGPSADKAKKPAANKGRKPAARKGRKPPQKPPVTEPAAEVGEPPADAQPSDGDVQTDGPATGAATG